MHCRFAAKELWPTYDAIFRVKWQPWGEKILPSLSLVPYRLVVDTTILVSVQALFNFVASLWVINTNEISQLRVSNHERQLSTDCYWRPFGQWTWSMINEWPFQNINGGYMVLDDLHADFTSWRNTARGQAKSTIAQNATCIPTCYSAYRSLGRTASVMISRLQGNRLGRMVETVKCTLH